MTRPPVNTVERRRSRPALVVVAVLAAVGAAMLVTGGGGEPGDGDGVVGRRSVTTPPPTVGIEITDDTAPPEEALRPFLQGTDTRLLIAEGDRFSVIDLASGRTLVPSLPLGGFAEHQPLVVGDRLVIDERYVAYSIDRRFATSMVELGPADSVVPAGGDEVWLVDQRRDTATRMSADGRVRRPPIAIPDGTWRTLGAAGGIVLSSPREWRHHDRDGRPQRQQQGVAIAARGDAVAWLPQACRTGPCDLQVSDLRTGGERAIRVTAGPLVALYEAKLSPDGRWLALSGDLDDERGAYEVVMIDLSADPAVTLEAAQGLTTAPGVLSWGPDSEWLFWSRRRFGSNEAVITAFTITGSSTVELPVVSGSVFTFSAF